MGEKQSRSVNCGGRAATFVFVALVLLAYGPIPGRVWAQGNTAQRDGAAGTAAQREPAGAEASQEPSQVTAEALSLRYRFIEKYSLTEDPNHPELITQYRVGIRETQKTEREKSQGAPDRLEISRQTIYTERAARVGKLGEMVSAVRRYDRFQRKDPGAIHPPTPPLFEGLTVWMRRQSGRKPLVLSLTSERPLRDFEFTEISKQVFVPQLPAMFPQTPRRVGDTWSIPRTAAQYLVGEIPEPDEYALTGTLVEVRRSAAGPGLTAVIGLAGQMNLSFGLSALKAQIHFAFEPAPGSPAAIAPAPGAVAGDDASAKSRAGNDAGVVDARGRIARVLMLWGVSDVLPDSDGRLKQTATYELNLERRFAPATNEAAGPNAALIVPDPAPTPDESNSWLMFDDPQGRFHFLHPQTLLLTSRTMDPKLLEFVDQSPGPGAGQDVFLLRLAPGNEDPQADRAFRDPQLYQRSVDADWAKQKLETLRGQSQWLPEADWAPLRVYRKELGVKTAGADGDSKEVQRIFIDYYLVLTKRNECFHVDSMTVRNDHVSFRTQVEGMIKSFQFGPWDSKVKPVPASATPAATPTPPR